MKFIALGDINSWGQLYLIIFWLLCKTIPAHITERERTNQSKCIWLTPCIADFLQTHRGYMSDLKVTMSGNVCVSGQTWGGGAGAVMSNFMNLCFAFHFIFCVRYCFVRCFYMTVRERKDPILKYFCAAPLLLSKGSGWSYTSFLMVFLWFWWQVNKISTLWTGETLVRTG